MIEKICFYRTKPKSDRGNAISIRILEKNWSNTGSQGLKAFFSKWRFTNRSYYKAGNLEIVHFLTKLNILLKSTFCLFFLVS